MIHALLGGIIWWAFGFGFAFGDVDGGFIGKTYFFGYNLSSSNMAKWFLSYTFACTSTTIVSGSVAERISINCYIGFAVIMCGFTYPLIVAWTWGGGFLDKLGYQDFAGSGVVHITGAFSGLMGAIILGPRLGKFKDIRSGVPIAEDKDEFEN
jgi:Amt family ammonium transporter